MKQHNHWKLVQLQKRYIQIALWGFGLLLLLLSAFNKTINFNLVSSIIGVISLLFGALLMLFENYFWKQEVVQKAMLKGPFFEQYWTPVLEGRWTGTLIRDNVPHKFVLEIVQSYSSISCVTYSMHSSSTAVSSEILFDDQVKIYNLIFYWQAKTTTVQPNTGTSNLFNGFTVLNIKAESGKITGLSGSYFTDRQPTQTNGRLDLAFQQKELKHAFE